MTPKLYTKARMGKKEKSWLRVNQCWRTLESVLTKKDSLESFEITHKVFFYLAHLTHETRKINKTILKNTLFWCVTVYTWYFFITSCYAKQLHLILNRLNKEFFDNTIKFQQWQITEMGRHYWKRHSSETFDITILNNRTK